MKISVKKITKAILDELWRQYLSRVSYAQKYVDLIESGGGSVVNDHIALRTFNIHSGEQPEGIQAISHLIQYLGYTPVADYAFKKKKLNATHFEHPDPLFPKIFVSQLEISDFPDWAQNMISETVRDTPYLISNEAIELLNILKEEKSLTSEAGEILIAELAGYFRRPWDIPKKSYVLRLNDVSQYAAWVMLHGNAVNHFTAFVNYQEMALWPDLASTCKGLEEAGIPMKEKIEGNTGSILQQSATQAVKEDVLVKNESGGIEKIEWTYAYYELAQRGLIDKNGKKELFSGFLGEQASHLFDMTQTRDN